MLKRTARHIAVSINIILVIPAYLLGFSPAYATENQLAASPDSLVEQTRALIQKAAKYYDEYDLARAKPLLEQAQKNLQSGRAGKAGHLDNVLVELGQCYYAEKNYDAALDCFEKALQIRMAAGLPSAADRAALADLYARHGEAVKAERLFEAAHDWTGLAEFFRKQADPTNAALALSKYFSNLSGKPACLLSPVNISLRKELESYYKQANRMKDAELLYTDLLSAFQDSNKINIEDLQIAMGYLADFYYRNNVLEKAEPTLLKELDITKPSREKLVCLFNIASLSEIMHNSSRAEKYYKQALEFGERLKGLSFEEKINVIAQRSDFLWRQRKFQDAEKSIRAEQAELDNSRRSAWFRAYAGSRLGLLYLSEGKIEQGESYLQDMLADAVLQYKTNLKSKNPEPLVSATASLMEQKSYEGLRMFYLQNHSWDKLQELALKQLDFMSANGSFPYQKYEIYNLLFWAYCQAGRLDEAMLLLQKNAEVFDAEEPDQFIDRAILAGKRNNGKEAEQELIQAKKYLEERDKPDSGHQKWPPAEGLYEINYSVNIGGSSQIATQSISNGTISNFPIRLLNTADFKLYQPEPNLFAGIVKRADGTERQSALFSIKEVDPAAKRIQRLYSLPLDENIASISQELLPAYFERLFASAYAIEGRNNEALLTYEKASEFEKRIVQREKNYLDAKRLLNSTLIDYAEFLKKQGKLQAAEIVKHQASKVAQEITILSLSQ